MGAVEEKIAENKKQRDALEEARRVAEEQQARWRRASRRKRKNWQK